MSDSNKDRVVEGLNRYSESMQAPQRNYIRQVETLMVGSGWKEIFGWTVNDACVRKVGVDLRGKRRAARREQGEDDRVEERSVSVNGEMPGR